MNENRGLRLHLTESRTLN